MLFKNKLAKINLMNVNNSAQDICLSLHDYTASGRKWIIKRYDADLVSLYRNTYDLSLLDASILAARDINHMNLFFNDFSEIDSISMFLKPSLQKIMQGKVYLPDLETGCIILADAINCKKKIGLFGDYDVDGMSSCAMMMDFLNKYGVDPSIWIPSREDGYGLSRKGIDAFIAEGVQVMFIFDCGSQDVELIEYVISSGLIVVIIDHHKIAQEHAKPHAFINPFRTDVDYVKFQDYRQLCAAGLCFMFLSEFVRRQTGRKDIYDLMLPYTIYASLATVCDVMSLRNILNRAMVQTGLNELMQRKHIGLNALMDMLKMPKTICANHLGFTIGPRLNAGARMHKEELSFKLLTTKSPLEALEIANKLEGLNQQRRHIEEQLVQLACEQADKQINRKVLFIHGRDWHVGVVGIISSLIKDIYHKPVIVVSYKQTEEGLIGKGSARSIEGIDIGQLLQRAVVKGLLINGGGHALAAGLSIKHSKMNDFIAYIETELTGRKSVDIAVYNVDAVTSLEGFLQTKDIDTLAPFGCDFSSPKIAISNVRIDKLQAYKTHTLVQISQGNITSSFFAFRTSNSRLGDTLSRSVGRVVDVLLNISDNGQGHIMDISTASR